MDERATTRLQSVRRALASARGALLAVFVLTAVARAHEGPPFPILVDEPDAPWSVSVWADPDVGIGTFWVLLDPLDASVPLPGDTRVTVHVAPADGRLPETSWEADADIDGRRQEHEVQVDFPTREFWLVRVDISSASAGASAEHVLRVEVTPPGYGPIDLLLYSWPFAALAALWLKALTRRRARGTPPASNATTAVPVSPDPGGHRS